LEDLLRHSKTYKINNNHGVMSIIILWMEGNS